MKLKRIDSLPQWIALLAVIVTSCGSAWAASGSCTNTNSGMSISSDGTGGTGTGGTGAIAESTGTGGTGAVAEDTGAGGTGIRLGVYMAEMQLAGNVANVQGTVEAKSNGRSRLLAKGDSLCVGETVMTSRLGSVQIRMIDDGLITVRPQTQLRIEKFVYSGTNKDTSLLVLLKGACRVITGKVGKGYPQNDVVKTPVATINVHGAEHEVTVILPGDGGSYPSGTYDKVNNGTTSIRTEKGEIDIHPNQVGFAADIGKLPTLLKEIPGFYNTLLP